MANRVTYSSYLALDKVLSAQHPASEAHDELLFIIVHQSSELWLKLCLHELTAARAAIESDNLRPALKMLARVARAQGQLIQSWDVLSTMTPHDYSSVRPHLGTSSGFQSPQYRMMEFILGGRNKKHVKLHEEDADWAQSLTSELFRPSIYHAVIELLVRRGLPVQSEVLTRDLGEFYQPDQSVEDAWATVYRNPQEHWDLYELAEKLVDLEYHFQRWRFGHLKTVERVIGFKRGTGATEGVPYLAGVLRQEFFPELLSVRTSI